MPLIRWGCLLSACVLLAACQSLGTENIPATMQSDLTAYAVQATEIRTSGESRAAEAAATISAAQTQAAYYTVYNQVLVATVRAGETAVPAQMLVTGGEMEGSFGVVQDMEFLQIVMTDTIRNADRCAQNDMALFDVAATEKIYLTVVVTNLIPGTLIEVLWRNNGQQVHRTSWTAEMMSSNECVAMELTRDQVAFVAGEWEAVLMADDRVIQSVPFAMIESTSTQ
jgi:hypothetical protein